jgi:nucleotide sugar dehydrogenase
VAAAVSQTAKTLLGRIRDKEAVVTIVGLGYVGLPTAVAFAEQGFQVIGADLNPDKVELVNQGKATYWEGDLEAPLRRVLETGRLEATTDIEDACGRGDCVLLIVPTPVDEAKQPDLSYVEAAAQTAAKGLKQGQLVILESTTYPGTSEEIILATLQAMRPELQPGRDYGVAYCPERYNPGDPKHTLATLTRVVGALDEAWGDCAAALYGTLNGDKIARVRDLRTAEAVKVIENIQRDLNIALVNEFALIFERLGIDTYEVLEAAATKWNFVKYTPGPGVGGHCLPVDPYYLTSVAERVGHRPRVILAGRATNDSMPLHVVDLVTRGLNEAKRPVKGSRIAVLGLAYKGGTTDPRESPAEHIIKHLLSRGAELALVDPLVDDAHVQEVFALPKSGLDEALHGAHAVIVVTDHQEIRDLDLHKVRELTAPECVFVDTRNLFDPKEVDDAGLLYWGIGRMLRKP